MSRCPSCSAVVPEGSRFCPRCGATLADSTRDPTRTVRSTAAATPAPRASSGPSVESRFFPGKILAGRYRIFGLVGRGGMG